MRKTIVQILAVLLAVGFLSQFAFAGGIDNKQNFSANYIGSASRNAAIDGADIAAYNPAGIMQMENGLYAELDTQVLFLEYDHIFDGESHDVSEMPIVPSLFTIYKQDKWAAFGTFTINGGGGKVEYDKGNIVTEAIGNAVFYGLFSDYAAYGLDSGGTFTDQFAGVESIYYTLTAGGSYAVNDIFSVSAAARYITAIKEVDIHGTYTTEGSVAILGKYEEDADGFGGVFGINIRPNKNINIAFKYETKVELDWYCDIDPAAQASVASTVILGGNGKTHGQTYPRDLPAVFSAGLVWNVTPQLSISPSYTLYFEKEADWDTTQNTLTTKNSYDLALSVGYSFNDKLSATAGYMYTDIGLTPADYSLTEKMSPPLDCHTVAVGTKYKVNEKISLSTGLMGCFYVSDSAPAVSVVTPAVEYEKTVYVVAFNLEYKFF